MAFMKALTLIAAAFVLTSFHVSGRYTGPRLLELGYSTQRSPPIIGGIYGVSVPGTTMPVVVSSSGQLGMQPSSEHYKTDIAPMLLNEVQKQAAEIRDLKQQGQQKIATQDAKIRSLEQQVAELIKVQSKDQLVAQR